MPTSGYLSQSLRRPLPTKDDGILRTVADAAGYMMALSKDRQRAHWQRAARLLPTRRTLTTSVGRSNWRCFMIASSTCDRAACSQERVLQCMREKRLTVDAATSSKRRTCQAFATSATGPLNP